AGIAPDSVVEHGTEITLSCAEEEAKIHYTTDNTTPTQESPEYSSPIVITEDTIIKAVAFRDGFESSDVLEVFYTVAEENNIYTIQFHKNSDQATGEMTLQTLPKDSVIILNNNAFVREGYYFTGWNTKADGTGTSYEEGARLFGFDMGSEKVITLYATWRKIETLDYPTADVPTGSVVRKGREVSLDHSLKQVRIFYTTDGTIPTTNSNLYTTPFVITQDTVIIAIAVKDNYKPSEPVEFVYTVAETGEIWEEDVPQGGLEDIPEGLWIAGINKNGYKYTGTAIKPEVRVYDHTTLLKEGKDYTITYSKNVNVSKEGNAKKTPLITVKGKGNYTGKDTAEFKINPKSIQVDEIQVYEISAAYNKKQQKPVPTVYDNGKKLKNKKDYTLEYVGLGTQPGAFQEPGTYKILIYGTGNYRGVRALNFVITDNNLISKATVSKIKNQPYHQGEEVKPEFTVKYKGKELVENSDYIVTYLNNTKPGKATVVIHGVNAFSGVKYVDFNIAEVSMKNAQVSGIYDCVYTGEEICFDDISVYADRQLVEGEDYTIRYLKHNKVGTATVVITGINGYTGIIKKTFQITQYNMVTDPEDKIQVHMEEETAYVKGGAKAKVILKFGNQVLKENVDYTVKYKNMEIVEDDEYYENAFPMITISGKGNFSGSFEEQYRILRKNISV
ncbi:MAG: chitobiase/beta-hexosaminidase C-terminal domain-containing protein, partial [Lachnospiraceae bacterium]|nr:chitobiase/beta-hexosaminidase C-terminal domain-containing protein [Lachnospiraceae bacterium]